MPFTLVSLLQPPTYDDHERAQAARLLYFILWVMFLVTLGAGLSILPLDWRTEASALYLAAGMSLLGIVLIKRGAVGPAAAVLCVTLFSAICLAAFVGVGVYDEAVLAFAPFILIATFAFGTRRGLLPAIALSTAAVYALTAMQAAGWIDAPYPVSWLRPGFLSLIFVGMGGVSWAVRGSWRANLSAMADSYDATLHGWGRLLEAKGGGMDGHSLRVVGLAEALGKRLGCTSDEIAALRRGAYLHDIGKMAIPDAILLKPGPLDADERRIVEQHPIVAQEIIADIPYLKSAAVVPYHHHEQWDGNGYPAGLRGEEIPRIARIFTVADQWDALCSDRPYRPAWPEARVVAYMRHNVGAIYDPEVVDAFLTMLDEGALDGFRVVR